MYSVLLTGGKTKQKENEEAFEVSAGGGVLCCFKVDGNYSFYVNLEDIA